MRESPGGGRRVIVEGLSNLNGEQCRGGTARLSHRDRETDGSRLFCDIHGAIAHAAAA
jgi:hypothetical protein